MGGRLFNGVEDLDGLHDDVNRGKIHVASEVRVRERPRAVCAQNLFHLQL